ncbi:MAG: PRC-barrel domain-containing protein [Hyphomicrobiaceae bacterium]
MNNKLALGLLAAGALALSLPAIAQQQKAPTPATPPAATTPAPTTPPPAATAPAPVAPVAKVAIPKNVFTVGQLSGQYLAKDRLIGTKVQNKDGQIIGDIEDLIVGPGNQVVGVIMGTGGFLGVGEKRVGVQLGALVFTQKDGKQVVMLPSATKDVLAAIPAYKRAEPKKTLAERAAEKAKELTDKTKDTAKDAAKAAQEKAAPLVDKAKEAVKPAEKK